MTPRRHPSRLRRASVLILAMAVLIVLTSLTLLFARGVRMEAAGSANYVGSLQAEAVARGAAEYVRYQLQDAAGRLPDDSELRAEAVPIGEGYFWLLKSTGDDDRTWTYGLNDESGKLNLNTASLNALSLLPEMTTDLAAGIIDWRDGDDTAEAGGAESQYYLMLPEPYHAKNSRFETVDELLLVKDITPQLLDGEDANRNGILDPGEDLNGDGRLDRGLYPFVTVHSVEANVNSDGRRRLNVNSATPARLRTELSGSVSGERLEQLVARIRQNRPYASVIDLYYRAEFDLNEFRQVAARFTTTNRRTLRGLVNVNTAPREVLLCLPGFDESDAQAIVSYRQSSSNAFANLADLIDVLPRDKAIAVGNLVTTQSYRCTADIVAVERSGRSFKRYMAVYDMRESPPRIIYWRDLTSLGWPLDPQILITLRAGGEPTGFDGRPARLAGGAR